MKILKEIGSVSRQFVQKVNSGHLQPSSDLSKKKMRSNNFLEKSSINITDKL